MSPFSLLALSLAYAGMVALCLGLERHARQVFERVPARSLLRGLRLAGWTSLLASLLACARAWGWPMAPVAWIGLLSVGGLVLVLLLPYAPRLATGAAALWVPLCLLLVSLAG